MKNFAVTTKRSMRAQGFLVFATVTLVMTSATVGGLRAWSRTSTVELSGEIQDSACAGTAAHVEKECAQTRVRNGAKWVLYDPSKGEIYQLDDQRQAAAFAAQTVVVVGTLNKSNETVHVVRIKGA